MLNASMARNHDIVEYIPVYEIAICLECKYALNKPPGIRKHLELAHHWSSADAKQVDQAFVGKPIRSPSDHETPWIHPDHEDLTKGSWVQWDRTHNVTQPAAAN